MILVNHSNRQKKYKFDSERYKIDIILELVYAISGVNKSSAINRRHFKRQVTSLEKCVQSRNQGQLVGKIVVSEAIVGEYSKGGCSRRDCSRRDCSKRDCSRRNVRKRDCSRRA